MNIKSILAKPFAKQVTSRIYKQSKTAVKVQQKLLKKLIAKAENTDFGLDHNFKEIKSYEDFKKEVPIADYEDLKPYIDKVVAGEPNVLWKGKPLYFAKTSDPPEETMSRSAHHQSGLLRQLVQSHALPTGLPIQSSGLPTQAQGCQLDGR